MLTKDELPACPVATTLMLIGNKWKIFIVQRLLNDGIITRTVLSRSSCAGRICSK